MSKILNIKVLLLVIIVALATILIIKSWSKSDDKKKNITISMTDFVLDLNQQMIKLDSLSLKKNGYSAYRLDEVEIEMNVIIKDSLSAKGALQYEILTQGNNKKYEKEAVQKITFHIKRPKL